MRGIFSSHGDRGDHHNCIAMDVFEFGSALIKVHSFNTSGKVDMFWAESYSPTTCRVSISTNGMLRIFDDQNSNRLLEETGLFDSHCFSTNGSLFAASTPGVVHIWKYDSGHYIPWRKFRRQNWANQPLQFSPTPSNSILDHTKNFLQVWRLHDLPTVPSAASQQHALSRSDTYIATARKFGSTVTIIDLRSQVPHFVDTGLEITGLVLTGNVLLVTGLEQVVAWLLTKEGPVGGVFGNGRASPNDCIWSIPRPMIVPPRFSIDVKNRVGVISGLRETDFIYDTETGEVFQSVHAPRRFSSDLPYFYLGQYNALYRDGGGSSQTTLREGWVEDPEGRCILWVPDEWRNSWDTEDWLRDVGAQFSTTEDQPVIIKF